MLKNGAKLVVFLLAIYGASELFPWSLENLFRLALGFQRPTASAYYRISIENGCTQDLNLSAVLINDLQFAIPSNWTQRQNKRLGWVREKQAIVCSGKSATLILPSNVDPRIGYVLITAMSQIKDEGTRNVAQNVALYLRHWTPEEIKVSIKDADLQVLDLSTDQALHLQ